MAAAVHVPPRLFVIFAKSAPVAVVIRRGPAAWAHLILWDTQRDVFTEGAWFRGRIYEEKCDVSPDGQLFVHAAHQGRRLQTGHPDSWTAVSRPPWLHALALWSMGTTYGGGGRFVGDRRLIVRAGGLTHESHPTGLDVASGPADLQASTGEVAEAAWSGRDQRGRLVFANDGRIFERTSERDVELADFNEQRPDPQRAPEWAMRPIRPLRRGR